MDIRSGSLWNAAHLYMNSINDEQNVNAIVSKPTLTVQSASDASITRSDTLSLTTSGMSSDEVRENKIAQLREVVQAGRYQISSSTLSKAMMDKVAAGEAPELSFLSEK